MKKILAVFLLAIFIISALPCVSAGFTVNGQTPANVVKAEQRLTRKPDLTLTSDDIIFSSVSPTAGDTVTITATIRNIGTGNARNVQVGFYDGASLIGIKNAGLIVAGGTGTTSIQWKATPAGDHTIRVVADPNKKISESKEGNNEASKTIIVGAPAVVHDVAVTSVTSSATKVTSGEVVTITVVVKNQGTETETFDVTLHYDSFVIGTQTVTGLVASATETLTFSWDTTGLDGTYTIRAEAILAGDDNPTNNTLTDGTVTVSPPGAPPTATHELFIEIDYMVGYAPTPEVLNYIKWYYMGNNPSGELISVTFYVDEVVPLDTSVSDTDFWAIEAKYNNKGDDKYGAGDPVFGTAGVYSSKWKWVLYGTTVEGAPNVVGYTYVVIGRVGWTYDLLAGNYIFIADKTADDWATNNKIEPYGAEAAVLMHEMGHSIGIAKLSSRGAEIYDPDSRSVMSYLSTANAGLYWAWYYSKEYWATRNMKYYTV